MAARRPRAGWRLDRLAAGAYGADLTSDGMLTIIYANRPRKPQLVFLTGADVIEVPDEVADFAYADDRPATPTDLL